MDNSSLAHTMWTCKYHRETKVPAAQSTEKEEKEVKLDRYEINVLVNGLFPSVKKFV